MATRGLKQGRPLPRLQKLCRFQGPKNEPSGHGRGAAPRVTERSVKCGNTFPLHSQILKVRFFFWSEPVAFRRIYGLEPYSRTSGESNNHRQSVSATRVTPYQLSHEGDEILKVQKCNFFSVGNRTYIFTLAKVARLHSVFSLSSFGSKIREIDHIVIPSEVVCLRPYPPQFLLDPKRVHFWVPFEYICFAQGSKTGPSTF